MDAVLKKLNFKDHKLVFVLNSPASFEVNLDSIKFEAEIKKSISSNDKIDFAIAFGITQQEVDQAVNSIATNLMGDAVFWFCYPKGSSKNYTCNFNRDTGWNIMGKYNLEGVRQVSIDEDWSAIRFRKIEYIKNFTRSKGMALSSEGKKRAKK